MQCFNRHTLRIINGCKRSLELQLACKRNEIEVLKSKKSKDIFEVESCVRGHHIYKQVWTPFIGKELTYSRD